MKTAVIKTLIPSLAQNLPLLIVSIVAFILLSRRRAPATALYGFGIIGVLLLLQPLVYFATIYCNVLANLPQNDPSNRIMAIYRATSIVSTIATCVAYILILLGLLRLLPRQPRP